jgi:hypothetical protein
MTFFFRYRFVLGFGVGLLWLGMVVSVVRAGHNTNMVHPLHMPYFPAQYAVGVNMEPIAYALPKIEIVGSSFKPNGDHMKYGPLLVDISGDGMMDMVYSKSLNPGQNPEYWEQYVALGTGMGFDVVYYCKTQDFNVYGHCAGSQGARQDQSGRVASLQELWSGNSSGTLKQSFVPYALPDVRIHGFSYVTQSGSKTIIPQFTDWNGDGLLDMIYSVTTDGNNISDWKQFVLLNNGQGFDNVYTCQKSSYYFYGDCADLTQ